MQERIIVAGSQIPANEQIACIKSGDHVSEGKARVSLVVEERASHESISPNEQSPVESYARVSP